METLQQINGHVNGKQPICNGSINKTLTIEEMLAFDLETKKTFLHYTQVSGEYAHHFPEVDHSLYEKLPPLYSYETQKAMNDEQVNEALPILINRFNCHHQMLLNRTYALHFHLGKEIHEAEKRYQFSGELQMTLAQLCGYVTAIGHWNDFEPAKIIPVLKFLDQTAPRRNYGVNNCNTGTKQHYWTIKSDYIFMNWDYVTTELKEVQEWFKIQAHPKQSELQADSMRIAVEDYEHDAHAVQIVMWWD